MEQTISKHFLVPKHAIVPKEKEDELLKLLGTEKRLLPRILVGDAAVAEVGAIKGDIVKITRESLTAGKSPYYRLVF